MQIACRVAERQWKRRQTCYGLLAMANDGTERPGGSGARAGRLYPRLLGPAWHELDPSIKQAHADVPVLHAEGTLQVSRAPGRVARWLLDLVGVPPAAADAHVRLTVCQRGPTEHWQRVIGGRALTTVQAEAPGRLLAERIGVLEFRFRLAVKRGDLLYRQERAAICLGPMRLPLPDWLAPQIAAREGPAGEPDLTRIEVRVTSAGGALFFSYRGTVRWPPLRTENSI
jgi:hypothetical protein